MATYYAYILQSRVNDSFYKGSTPDLLRSLNEHNAGEEIETRTHRPWNLVWYKTKTARSGVLILEKKIKKLSVNRTIDFIKKNTSDNNLEGVDLSLVNQIKT